MWICSNLHFKKSLSSELDYTCDLDKNSKYVQEFGMETSCDKATWRSRMQLTRSRDEVR
jgi:hypothetical protein